MRRDALRHASCALCGWVGGALGRARRSRDGLKESCTCRLHGDHPTPTPDPPSLRTRLPKTPTQTLRCHVMGAGCSDFALIRRFLVVLQQSNSPLQYIGGHLAKIHGLDWDPTSDCHLATSSQDCHVKVCSLLCSCLLFDRKSIIAPSLGRAAEMGGLMTMRVSLLSLEDPPPPSPHSHCRTSLSCFCQWTGRLRAGQRALCANEAHLFEDDSAHKRLRSTEAIVSFPDLGLQQPSAGRNENPAHVSSVESQIHGAC